VPQLNKERTGGNRQQRPTSEFLRWHLSKLSQIGEMETAKPSRTVRSHESLLVHYLTLWRSDKGKKRAEAASHRQDPISMKLSGRREIRPPKYPADEDLMC
jgi:hypothetical protein